MGSTCAAWIAGYRPKRMPTAHADQQGQEDSFPGEDRGHAGEVRDQRGISAPMPRPTSPPVVESTTVSTRNW